MDPSFSNPRGKGHPPTSSQARLDRQHPSAARGGDTRHKSRISGIPEFEEFVAGHEEREKERRASSVARADEHIRGPNELLPPSPGYVFEMSDLGDRLRRDPSDDQIARAAHRRNRHRRRASPLPSTFFPSAAEPDDEPRMPAPIPPPVYPTSTEDEDTLNARHHNEWRARCLKAFREKQNLQAIPAPPLGSCHACHSHEIAQHSPPDITCSHSMDKIYRSSLLLAGKTEITEYYLFLKQQRNVWHPDRFSTCDNDRYPSIGRDACTLFRIAKDLLEIEKKMLLDLGIELPISRTDQTRA